MQDLERCLADQRALFTAAAVRARTEEKAQDVTIEVFSKAATLQTRKEVAEDGDLSIPKIDRAGEMLDEDVAGKTILARKRGRCEKLSRHADIGFVIKPEDAKSASTIFEPRQEGLDGMDGMQELETICATPSLAWAYKTTTGVCAREGSGGQLKVKIDTVAVETVCQDSFAVDTEEAFASKIADNVDTNGLQQRPALTGAQHF